MKSPERIMLWLAVAVFSALPIVGLVAGPSYAALVFGLGGIQFLYASALRRTWPSFDRTLLGLAIAFACVCWVSTLWSIAPDRSWRGALQVTAIFAGALIVLGYPTPSARTADILFRSVQVAFVVGAMIISVDALTGYHLQSFIAAGKTVPPTKYNRGVDYLILIAAPVFAHARLARKWPVTLALLGSVILVLIFSLGATGRIAAVVGVVVFTGSILSRRAALNCLRAIIAAIAVFTPLFIRVLAKNRAFIASHFLFTSHLHESGLARLEIWDYMSARVFERPFLGWGLWSSKVLPIRPDELSHYVYTTAHGNYPHDQWLQLWVETGAVGAAIALAFALVTLARCRSLASRVQPFAYAAFACALTISLADFQITTDSWWAALVASTYLFKLLRDDRVNRTNHAGVLGV